MLRKSLSALLLAAAVGVAQADTLLIDGIALAEASQVEKPRAGLNKSEVEARFGQPARTVAAIGDPPISRWEYTGFIVYFENDLVIHSVVRH
jgi:hypothetical protein